MAVFKQLMMLKQLEADELVQISRVRKKFCFNSLKTHKQKGQMGLTFLGVRVHFTN